MLNRKKIKHKRLLIVLITFTLCFIWGNSLMPAFVSGAISGYFKDIINLLLHEAGNSTALSGEGVLRKIAHAAEFAALGTELTLIIFDKLKAKLSGLILRGLGAALIDETIQLFVSGRSGQIKDVWIDFGGFIIGVLLVLIIAGFIRSHKRKTLYHE